MNCLSVQELNVLAQEALNTCFGTEIWVVGEIHGLKVHAKSGHIYFDLVEKASAASDQYVAKVSCAFFRGSYVAWRRSLALLGFGKFEPANGIEVKLKARVDLFVKEGRFQVIVSEIDPTYTFGAIARRRAETIEYLKTNDLLERNKGLDLAVPSLNIGLITSRDSAAYRDFTSIILGSSYSFRITLFDAHMQGDNTIREVTRGIRALEQHPEVDVIVIIRGGGAKTDLFVFDDLNICKAVAMCTKPVMTGIGHEIDLSVADMTAHTHFVTPTDAARFFIGRAEELWAFLENASGEIADMAGNVLEKSSQQLDMLASKLAFLTQKHTSQGYAVLRNATSSLYRTCTGMITAREKELMRIRSGMSHHVFSLLQARQSLLDRFERELSLMHPAETLRRGYSITLNRKGKAILDAEAASVDDRITTILSKGKIYSIVSGKEPGDT